MDDNDGDPDMIDQKVIFIRGAGRSGTKNLADQLAGHPQLARIPVNQVLPEELIDWSRDRLQSTNERITDQAVAAACRAYFIGYGRTLAGRDGILLHKSTMNAHHLATLLDFWPDCRIVYLVRHPIGWTEALLSADIHDYAGLYGYEAGVADTVVRWCTEMRTFLRSPAGSDDRLLKIRFEELIGNHAETIERILDFLELDQSPLPAYGSPERFDKPFVLSESERRWVIDVTRDTVARLGYDPEDWSPSVPLTAAAHTDLYPQRRLHSKPPTVDGLELIRQAVRTAQDRGHQRIGLFGAGYFLRLLCSELRTLNEQVTCVIDENPALRGLQIGDRPILRPNEALQSGIDAVIPTTFVRQQQLAERWKQLSNGSVPLIPLWCDGASAADTRPAFTTVP